MILSSVEYLIYHCKVHNKSIYYFKTDNHITGKFHCWECQAKENHKSVPNTDGK